MPSMPVPAWLAWMDPVDRLGLWAISLIFLAGLVSEVLELLFNLLFDVFF